MVRKGTKPLQFTLPTLLAAVTLFCLVAGWTVAPDAARRFLLGVGSGVALLATPLAVAFFWLLATSRQ